MKYWKNFQNIIAVMILIITVVSCGDSAYPYIEGNTYEVGGTSSYIPIIDLRASKDWQNGYYVYAFRTQADPRYSLTNKEPDFTKHSSVDSMAFCLVDDSGSGKGKMAWRYPDFPDTYRLHQYNPYKYSDRFLATTYTFYGYNFLKCTGGTLNRGKSVISFDNMTLDRWGGSDVLYGCSNPISTNGARTRYPELNIKHALAKLNFKLNGSLNKREKLMLSANFNGKFVVASVDNSELGFKPSGSMTTYDYSFVQDSVSFKTSPIRVAASSETDTKIEFYVKTTSYGDSEKKTLVIKPGYEYFITINIGCKDKKLNSSVSSYGRVWNTKD